MAFRVLNPFQQFLSLTGALLANGTITFYETGTLTKKATYNSSALSTPNDNPITLPSSGIPAVDVWGSGTYRVIVRTSAGVTIFDEDNITEGMGTLRADLLSSASGLGAELVRYDADETVKQRLDNIAAEVIITAATGTNVTTELAAIVAVYKNNVRIKFPAGRKLYLDPIVTRLSECEIDLNTCRLVPTTENQYMWTNYGARNTWYGGKIEPEGYTSTSQYWVMLWTHDATTPNGSYNKWIRPYMTGVHRGIVGYSATADFGSAAYRHEVVQPNIVGTGRSNAGGYGIWWDAKAGAPMGDSAGNDSKVIGGTVRAFETNMGARLAFTPKFLGVGSDSSVHAYRNDGCAHFQIMNQYTENVDNGLTLENSPYDTQMFGGTVSSATTLINGSQLLDYPVTSVGVGNVPFNISTLINNKSNGVLQIGGVNGVRLGEFDGTDNKIIEGIVLKLLTSSYLGWDLSELSSAVTSFGFQLPSGKTLKIGGSTVQVTFDSDGNITLVDGRYIKGGLQLEKRTSLRASSYQGSYIYDNGAGTIYLVCHDSGTRRAVALNVTL